MDDRRFDQLVRMVGQGASRRSILKGLLGLGGAAVAGGVAAAETDARTIGTRPTIPPPPAYTTRPPTTTTPAPCPGQQQCPNSTLCCPTGTCARSGNQAICCTGTVCGLECCDSPFECCDRECCAAGHTCLTQVFDEGPDVEEEVCCPAELACENQCCDGECFDPENLIDPENATPPVVAELTCCPVEGTVCEGSNGNLCCQGETPQCCLRGGVAICIAENACCTDVNCALGECDVCDISDPVNSQCVDNTAICTQTYGPCSVCEAGVCEDSEPLCGDEGCLTCLNGICIDNDAECPETCSTCFSGACVYDCRDGQGCCGDCGFCDLQTGECMPPIEDPCDVCQICRADAAGPQFNCQDRPNGQLPGCDSCHFCLNGACINVADTTDRFGDCGLCQYCVNGLCTNVPVASDPLLDCPPISGVEGVCCPNPANAQQLICQPGPTCGCDSDAECAGGLVCNLDSNTCVTTTTTTTTTTSTTTSTTTTTTSTTTTTTTTPAPTTTSTTTTSAPTTTTSTTTTTISPQLSLPLFKVNATGSPLAGACFTLHEGVCSLPPGPQVGSQQCVDDVEGQTIFVNLPDGQYCLIESVVPFGFAGLPPTDITIPADAVGRTLTNTPQTTSTTTTTPGCLPDLTTSPVAAICTACCSGCCVCIEAVLGTCVLYQCQESSVCEPPTSTTTTSTTTTSTTTTTGEPTTTTTRDPSLCLLIDNACDVANNRCCVGLGCQNPYGVAPYCDYCREDEESCQHDSNCCPGLLCIDGECLAPFCRTDLDCGACQFCNEIHECEEAAEGSDPGNQCPPCQICRTVEFGEGQTFFGCGPVANGTVDMLCLVPGAICCGGTCSTTAISDCACTTNEDCGPCLICDTASGACVGDCRTGENVDCCPGECHFCHNDFGLCHDDSQLCEGDCATCSFGKCVDDDFLCNQGDCESCVEGQCVFDCMKNADFPCCEPGDCGMAYCGPDGECVIEADPRDICGPCHECAENIFGEFNCTPVANGLPDPTDFCDEGTICCGGACSENETCGCATDIDCGPCLSCVAGSCLANCNRTPQGGGSCCFGCQECEQLTGVCEDNSDNCAGCADCEGGVCVDDDGDCGDCEICVNHACIFNCNNELGVDDCCDVTGTCGMPTCGANGLCEYAPNPAACLPCEDCVDTGSGGAYNCRPRVGCACVLDSDCGPCGICDDEGACAILPDGEEPDDGMCCSGAFVPFADCCTEAQCPEFSPMCHDNECIDCLVDTDCPTPDGPCFSYICDDFEDCEDIFVPSGTIVEFENVEGICCSTGFDTVFRPLPACCVHSDCTSGQFCCDGACEDAPCGCELSDDCLICERCNEATSTCVTIESGFSENANGFCCAGLFVDDGECCSSADCDSDEPYCLGHLCVECLNNLQCQIETNQCIIQFCNPDHFCDDISVPNGTVPGGRCCDGEFILPSQCCFNSECASSSLTPICHSDLHVCTQCDFIFGCPQCQSCDDSTGQCRFDCSNSGGANCCPGIGNQCDFGSPGACQCEPGLAVCDFDPDDPNSPLLCRQCCGDDASNCTNFNPEWDSDCVTCSGGQDSICISANNDAECEVDATGGEGFCSNRECLACLTNESGQQCNGHNYVCCSGFCRPGDNVCAPAGSVCDPGSNRACYTGPDGTEGVGPCVPGLETCNGDGLAWGPCIGEVTPTAEVCDGIDNDCDGTVDDGACGAGDVCCTNGTTFECCSAAECIGGLCCDNIGQTACGTGASAICCQGDDPQCCGSSNPPRCIPDGATCCEDAGDCSALINTCTGDPPVWTRWTCGSGGNCVTVQQNCDDGRPCLDWNCTPAGGCSATIIGTCPQVDACTLSKECSTAPAGCPGTSACIGPNSACCAGNPACTNLTNNPAHCGTCGRPCSTGQRCENGGCCTIRDTPCTDSTVCCSGDVCRPLTTGGTNRFCLAPLSGFAATEEIPDSESTCNPMTCADFECGGQEDGCGGVLDCGACCEARDYCSESECGLVDDGCGGELDCGACTTPAPVSCIAESQRCVSDDQCCAGLCRDRNCGDWGRRACRNDCAG